MVPLLELHLADHLWQVLLDSADTRRTTELGICKVLETVAFSGAEDVQELKPKVHNLEVESVLISTDVA